MKLSAIQYLILSIILIMLFPFTLTAEQYLFTQLPESNWVISIPKDIYKEKNRYLWIASSKGVYRYDGNEYKHYRRNAKTNNIPGNDVYKITPDKLGNLWVLTNNGLGRYDKQDDSFKLFTGDGVDGDKVLSYCHDKDGMYFGSINKIYRYDYASNKIYLFVDLKWNVRSPIKHIFKITEGKIVFSTDNNIHLLNIKTKAIKKDLLNEPQKISSVFVDSNNRIWIATYGMGLSCYKANGRLIRKYNTSNSQLSNNVILCIKEVDSNLWIGTDGGGINLLNVETGEIKILGHISGYHGSLPSNSIICMHYDHSNTIWIGTIKNGISCIRKRRMKTYTEVPRNSNYGLNNETVISLFQDKDKTHIWIGTNGDGLNRFDLKSKTFKHYPSTFDSKVVSIAAYTDDELLLSIYPKGFYIFNKHTETLRPLIKKSTMIKYMMLYEGIPLKIINEDKENIILTANDLFRYNLSSKKLEKILVEEDKKITSQLFPIFTTDSAVYLYDKHNVYELTKGSKTIKVICGCKEKDRINSAYIDADNNVWLATNNGIAHYSRRTQKYKQIPNNLFESANLIMPDNKGRIWIGAENKLYAYLKNENRFLMFGASDGAYNNKYLKSSRLITPQGYIVLGGTDGLLVIDKEFSIDMTEKPQIELTNITLDSVQIKKREISDNRTLEIPSGKKHIELKVTTVEEDILRPKMYRFVISGDNNQFIFESYSPSLVLNSLKYGQYNINVSCSTRGGEWTAPCNILNLRILPPWHKTSEFRFAIFLILTLIFTGVFYTLFKTKNSKLIIRIQEKEQDIYEEKIKFLVNINHELRTPLTLIYAPLHRILEQMPNQTSYFERLSKIYRQSERMKRLLDMVLDLRKIEVGEKKLHLDIYDVNEWLTNIIADFTDEGDANGIHIQTDLSDELKLIRFDKDKFDIILTNMLVNAIKHSKMGDTIIVKSEKTKDDYMRISIKDEGTGLEKEDTDKLFTLFYQGNNEKYGSGIGLAYSKLLVELHKGKIGATNNEDKGATFYFEIPVDLYKEINQRKAKLIVKNILTQERKYSATTGKENNNEYDTTNDTLLIVDDSTELTEFISETLAGKFKKIMIAANGIEACDILKKEIPDIVISDIMMPKMDGYQLCKKIKSDINISHIPILLLTACNEEQNIQEGYKLGADAFISKPFSIDTVYEIIKNKLKQREDIKKKYMQMSIIPEPKASTFSQADEIFLNKLNKIINENISNSNMDIAFICKEIGMSRASLYNKLKALTDMGCNEYINKIKLGKAMQLIKETNLNFTEIASETGFTTLKYFSAAFKVYTGITPTQYKSTHKDDKSHQIEK